MTDRTLTNGNRTYNNSSDLTLEVKIPKLENEEDWKILSTCSMAMTTKTIALC